MKCPSCNEEWPDRFKICPICGCSLTANLEGSGALAQGDNATALGEKAVQGSAGGDIVTGNKTTTFDMQNQQVDEQLNVAGDYYDNRKTVSPDDADPDTLRLSYLNRLFETAGQISLSGIDPKSASETEAQLNLGAVYTALLTLTPEECDTMVSKGCLPEHLGRNDGRRLSVVAQLDRHQRLVLLGDPGSGKSTFVNFVALCLAGEALGNQVVNLGLLTEPLPQDEDDDDKKPQSQPWSHGSLLPVVVVLRDFAARGLPEAGERATAKHLWDFIVAELETAALGRYAKYLHQHLQEQGALLLLDGLDEVPEAEARREQIKQAVEDFAATFGKCRILVTSRTYAYQQQAWRLRKFQEAVLAPFGQGQVTRFVDRWYAHIAQVRNLHTDDAQGRAELLKRAILNSSRLQALAARPLLLTLMASLHAWRGGSLPEKREELYNDTVDLLLDWWERPKVVWGKKGVVVQQSSLTEWLQVDRDKVRDLLDELAYQVHSTQSTLVGTADIREGDLVTGLLRISQKPDLRLQQVMAYLRDRAGLLLPRGVGVYTFPHRTFQEYLAACCLTDNDYPDTVAELARSEPGRWREVALLAGAKAARGTVSAVWQLVDALCYRDIGPDVTLPDADARGALLAGQALVENVDLSKPVSDRNLSKLARLQQHLVRILEEGQLPAVERVAAGVVLAQLGDPRPGVGLREDGLPDIVWCGVPAGEFIMGSGEDDEQAYSDEKPQHKVDVPAFRISKYPVTNAQFAAFVDAGGYAEQQYWVEAQAAGYWKDGLFKGRLDDEPRVGPDSYGSPFNLPNHPVVGITWYEVVAYCRWLSEQLGAEISLPSESQWEKAARGTDGRIYPWGDEINVERLNYSETGIGSTSAVGCFPGGGSPYGVLDMSGNVWEWTASESNPVLRGGSWVNNQRYARCAYRDRYDPYDFFFNIGFRLVVFLVDSEF